jgi:hypothetical protein
MKFCDKLYVAIHHERYSSADNPRVLGFAVPYGTTKAEKKRIDTVNGWANKKEDSRIIENKPTRGFKLLEVVSRYSTSNKLFRVLDPRGFELEISSDNLLDLALASTIVKGEIIEECVWAQHGGVYLIPTSSEQYKFWANGKGKPNTKIETGKYYASVGNLLSVFRFEGIYHHTYMEYKHVATSHDYKTGEYRGAPYHGRERDQLIVTAYNTKVNIKMNSGNKPSYIYTEFILDGDGNLVRKSIHARKSNFKDLKEYDQELSNEITSFIPDLTQWADRETYYYNTDKKYDTLTINSSSGFDAFFKTKEEAKSFDYSNVIAKLKPGNAGYRSNVDTSHITDSRRSYYYTETRVHDNAVQTFNIVDER